MFIRDIFIVEWFFTYIPSLRYDHFERSSVNNAWQTYKSGRKIKIYLIYHCDLHSIIRLTTYLNVRYRRQVSEEENGQFTWQRKRRCRRWQIGECSLVFYRIFFVILFVVLPCSTITHDFTARVDLNEGHQTRTCYLTRVPGIRENFTYATINTERI